jgi:transposase
VDKDFLRRCEQRNEVEASPIETLLMSLKERDRLALLRRVGDGQMTLVAAAAELAVSYRQAKRLWRGYRERGDAELVHGLRGRPSNNRTVSDDRRERALALYRERYPNFGPTLAAEQMASRDGLAIDHETLRGWLIDAGLWRAEHEEDGVEAVAVRPRRSAAALGVWVVPLRQQRLNPLPHRVGDAKTVRMRVVAHP